MRSRLATVVLGFAVLTLAGAASAQESRDDLMLLTTGYGLRVEADKATVSVTIDVSNVDRDEIRVAMPNWSPGSYNMHRAGTMVTDFSARDAEGRELKVDQTDPTSWAIATAGVHALRIAYRIPPFGRRFTPRFPDGVEPNGLHFQGPYTFMYVVGAPRIPVTCRYELPEGWKLANGMVPTDDPMVRTARDYDTFIDCPTIVGHFETRDFTIGKTPFTCVYWDLTGNYRFDMDAATDIVRRIVEKQGAIFGSFPFFHYHFLYSISQSGGGGGLEHLSSTSIGLSVGALERNPMTIAGISAHEYFHTWNVKRIRPVALGPFEYDQENYTGNLWVSEGWTSYYGDLSMLRAGLTPLDRYLGSMAGTIGSELSKARRKEHSVYWASRNVWHRSNDESGPRVDYYGKGELLGLLIDLKIRGATNGKKSLDDVMRFLNRWFAERNVGFEENDIERACTAISNVDFSGFFARHVRGTMDPPIAEILALAGLAYETNENPSAFPFFYRYEEGNGLTVRVGRGRDDASLFERGDRITQLDGQSVGDPQAFLAAHKAGDKVKLTVRRGEKDLEMEVTLREGSIRPSIRVMENASPEQLRIRESWMTGEDR